MIWPPSGRQSDQKNDRKYFSRSLSQLQFDSIVFQDLKKGLENISVEIQTEERTERNASRIS